MAGCQDYNSKTGSLKKVVKMSYRGKTRASANEGRRVTLILIKINKKKHFRGRERSKSTLDRERKGESPSRGPPNPNDVHWSTRSRNDVIP